MAKTIDQRMAAHIDGDFVAGGTMLLRGADGSVILTQRVLSIEPKSEIEMTFELPGDTPPSRCRYLLEPVDAAMQLTVEHYDLGPDQTHTREGWARWQASLKTYLERGTARAFALDYA